MRYAKSRVQGSLWSKGRVGIIAGAAVIGILIIKVPVVRWFLAIAAVIGIILVPGIRWYHEKFPVKDPEEDQIKLHLDDK